MTKGGRRGQPGGSKVCKLIALVSLWLVLIAACSPDEAAMQATVDAKIAGAVATIEARPTVTPQPTPTPVALPTPIPTPTPLASQLWSNWQQMTEISLPFEGVGYVSQGWDGRDPTHYGKWRFALDFVRLDQAGRAFKGRGDKPEDYGMWGVEVLAVAPGRVVDVEDSLPDNLPGKPALGPQSWGNHVIIDHGRGEFSEYSHLQRGSIRVAKGQDVAQGQPIGLVGSSGYTFAPHLHFQFQAGPDVQATTLPARFQRYYVYSYGRSVLKTFSVPSEGELVSSRLLL